MFGSGDTNDCLTCDTKWADAHVSFTGSRAGLTGGATGTLVVFAWGHVTRRDAVATGCGRQTERGAVDSDAAYTPSKT